MLVFIYLFFKSIYIEIVSIGNIEGIDLLEITLQDKGLPSNGFKGIKAIKDYVTSGFKVFIILFLDFVIEFNFRRENQHTHQ